MSAANQDPVGGVTPVTSVSTSDLAARLNPVEDVSGVALPAEPFEGKGVEGETPIWAGRYSMWNFFGGIALRVGLTVLYALSLVWSRNDAEYVFARINWVFGYALLLFWLYLGYRMARAWFSHYYRLTNRRLFVSNGIVRRRRNMMELLRVKDVTTRQDSLFERWFSLGTVMVVSTEKGAPVFSMPGVRNPKEVLDMIWHHARTERDLHSVKVDHV